MDAGRHPDFLRRDDDDVCRRALTMLDSAWLLGNVSDYRDMPIS